MNILRFRCQQVNLGPETKKSSGRHCCEINRGVGWCSFLLGGVLPKIASNFGWKLLFVSLGTPELYNAREEPASAATSPSQVTTVGCLVWEGLGCFKHCQHCHEAMSLKRLIGWLVDGGWAVEMVICPNVGHSRRDQQDQLRLQRWHHPRRRPVIGSYPKVVLVIGNHMG